MLILRLPSGNMNRDQTDPPCKICIISRGSVIRPTCASLGVPTLILLYYVYRQTTVTGLKCSLQTPMASSGMWCWGNSGQKKTGPKLQITGRN